MYQNESKATSISVNIAYIYVFLHDPFHPRGLWYWGGLQAALPASNPGYFGKSWFDLLVNKLKLCVETNVIMWGSAFIVTAASPAAPVSFMFWVNCLEQCCGGWSCLLNGWCWVEVLRWETHEDFESGGNCATLSSLYEIHFYWLKNAVVLTIHYFRS